MSTDNTFLTLKEVAVILRCSVDNVFHMCEDGRLPAVNIAKKEGKRKHYRIRRSVVEDLATKPLPPPPAPEPVQKRRKEYVIDFIK